MKSLLFVFDFLSPYSYQAWCWLRENKKFLDRTGYPLIPFPVVMSRLIKAHALQGPAEIESKRNFLFKDCLRWAALNKTPFEVPSHIPFYSSEALRLSLEKSSLIDPFFRLAWEKGIPLDDEKKVSQEMSLLGHTLKASTKSDQKQLKENTKWAIEQGFFGVPIFCLQENGHTKEWFWGRDSIPHVKLFMENRDPLDQNKYKQFLERYHT